MKRFLSKIGLVGLTGSAFLISTIFLTYRASASTQTDFIQEVKPTVEKTAKKYNLYASLMLAQAALESDFGQSQLSTQGYNYFGIKGTYNNQSITLPTSEYVNGKKVTVDAQFRKYPSIADSFNDYAQLLRNGLVGNSSFYSGSWRENAHTVSNAVNALVGKYATDPDYATSIMQLINTYHLSDLDNGITVESNKVANDSDSSSSKSKSSTSNLKSNSVANTTKSSNVSSSASATPKIKLAYIKSGNEQEVALAKSYRSQKLYSKIPGSTAKAVKPLNWSAKTINSKRVLIDMFARDKTNNVIWYRIHSAGNKSTKYWVMASALTLPSFYYQTLNGKLNAKQISNSQAYTHILSKNQIAEPLAKSSAGATKIYKVNLLAIDKNDPNNNWVRYTNASGKNLWVQLNKKQAIQTFPTQLNKKLKQDYAKYQLYTQIPSSNTAESAVAWSSTQVATINQIKVKSMGVRFSDRSFWYQIELNNHKYWISEKALQ